MQHRKKAVTSGSRKVWRITPDAPLGEFVEIGPNEKAAETKSPEKESAPIVLKPAIPANFRSSSYDLLNGLEVSDETDSIPGDLFEKLFNK